ncbi:MAG: hypothetical protein NW224_15140 [Leptolyngbyaceae cyanobacterium bins.302]|nr:hypothetical protein [Leptolyngbyaceae cyanobacterium bins.302]
MAKKTAKKKEKTSKDSQQHDFNILNHPAGQVSATVAGALVGEVMSIAIERVLQKFTNHQNGQVGNGEPDHQSLLAQVLSGLQDGVQSIQKPVQHTISDVEETAKSVAADVSTGTAQAVDSVKTNASTPIAQPLRTTKAATNLAVGEIVDTAKNVVGVLNTLKPEKKGKKGKKKHK